MPFLSGIFWNYIYSTKATLRDFARSCKGEDVTEFDVPIDITEDDIKKWLKDMMERGLSEKTRVKDISKMIRSIFHVRDRTIVVLLAKTGIRAGEMSALDVEDVNFESRALRVNKRIGNYFDLTIASGRKNKVDSMIPIDDETLRALRVHLAIRQPCSTRALFISDRGNRMFLADIDKMVKNWAIKTGTCKDSNRTDEKITPHFFRAWITYQLQINGCNPIVIDAMRGDKASNMRTFYANQVLPFEEVRREYERTVPKLGI